MNEKGVINTYCTNKNSRVFSNAQITLPMPAASVFAEEKTDKIEPEAGIQVFVTMEEESEDVDVTRSSILPVQSSAKSNQKVAPKPLQKGTIERKVKPQSPAKRVKGLEPYQFVMFMLFSGIITVLLLKILDKIF